MEDNVLRATLAHGCLHRVQHQLHPQVVGHRPANDLTAPGVQHDSEIKEPGGRRHLRDVGNPELVRTRGSAVPNHQVRRRPRILIPARHRQTNMPVASTQQPDFADQPRDPFADVPFTPYPPIGVDARCAMGLARAGVNGPNPFQQCRVGTDMKGGRMMPPSEETSPRSAKHARRRGNREASVVRADEPQQPDDAAPVSRAKQAIVFDQIPSSKRSCFVFSRRRDTSSRSTALRLGSTLMRLEAQARRPSFLSACTIQLRIDGTVGSNSWARSFIP